MISISIGERLRGRMRAAGLAGLALLLAGALAGCQTTGGTPQAEAEPVILELDYGEEPGGGDPAEQERLLGAFSAAIAANPNDAVAYNNRAVARFRLEGIPQSEKAAEKENQPALQEDWALRLHAQSRRNKAVSSDLEAALRIDPEFRVALLNRAHFIRYGRKDGQAAAAAYGEIIQRNSNDAWAYFMRGDTYFGLVEEVNLGLLLQKPEFRKRGLADLAAAIAIHPDYYPAHMRRSSYLITAGDYAGAVRDLDVLIRLEPQNAGHYNNRCWSYALMRQGRQALKDCNESLRLAPDSPAILDSRALAWWVLGDHDKARKDLERARQLNPEFADWRKRFGEFEKLF